MTVDYFIIVEILGAIATTGSVIWAIFVYKKNEERRLFAKTRENLSKLKYIVKDIDGHLSQPYFMYISSNIIDELRKLKPKDWSLEQFSDFLIDEKNHDLIAKAVHIGRLNCAFVEKFETQLGSMDQSILSLKQQLPVLFYSIKKLSYYIEYPAQYTMAPKSFDSTLGSADSMKKIIDDIKKHKIEEHYFTALANYCAFYPQFLMQQNVLGQKTFDRAERILLIIISNYSKMTDQDLRRSSRKQHAQQSKLISIDFEHAAEDAVEGLKIIREDFDTNDWDNIVDAKGKIVELMNTEI